MSLLTTESRKGWILGITALVLSIMMLTCGNVAHGQARVATTDSVKNIKFSSRFLVYASEQIGDSCVTHVFKHETHCFTCKVEEVYIPGEWNVVEGRKGKLFLTPRYKREL